MLIKTKLIEKSTDVKLCKKELLKVLLRVCHMGEITRKLQWKFERITVKQSLYELMEEGRIIKFRNMTERGWVIK